MLTIIQKAQEALSDILFPACCMGCKKEGLYLCESCQTFLSESECICPVCRRESDTGERHSQCSPSSLDGLVSIWEYEGPFKRMIDEAKEKGFSHIFRELTDRAILSLTQDPRYDLFLKFLSREETILTYIPTEEREERRRGFNQARSIAERLGTVFRVQVTDALEKDTQGAVVVGDIWETGNTMKERALALKRSGAVTIWGFTLGRAPYVYQNAHV
ncbi:MAG: hypothetical protein Q7S63_02645 [bacterium]|nr:hypothetical protein [bacterium]